jgi:acyl carrier protein
MSAKPETIAAVREAVTRVAGRDLSQHAADAPLDLDSINRISLVVELENVFGIEIDTGATGPELFDTLDSLAAYIDGLKG